jgi:hypothetical protein
MTAVKKLKQQADENLNAPTKHMAVVELKE